MAVRIPLCQAVYSRVWPSSVHSAPSSSATGITRSEPLRRKLHTEAHFYRSTENWVGWRAAISTSRRATSGRRRRHWPASS